MEHKENKHKSTLPTKINEQTWGLTEHPYDVVIRYTCKHKAHAHTLHTWAGKSACVSYTDNGVYSSQQPESKVE
jgi:hypothetical protein